MLALEHHINTCCTQSSPEAPYTSSHSHPKAQEARTLKHEAGGTIPSNITNGLIKVRRRWGQRHPYQEPQGLSGGLLLEVPPLKKLNQIANTYIRMHAC
jgi:hypothetical protein